jgi:hypothetical protein
MDFHPNEGSGRIRVLVRVSVLDAQRLHPIRMRPVAIPTQPPVRALFAWLTSHQPTVLFSQKKSATINHPAVLFSENKPAPAISHQPNEQAVDLQRPKLQTVLGKSRVRSLYSETLFISPLLLFLPFSPPFPLLFPLP